MVLNLLQSRSLFVGVGAMLQRGAHERLAQETTKDSVVGGRNTSCMARVGDERERVREVSGAVAVRVWAADVIQAGVSTVT